MTAIQEGSLMVPLSVLDLAPVNRGETPRDALGKTLDLARHAESLGYRRYWLAEHHNMRGIASAATSVVIGHVAAGTSRIRVGAGGIMLPNHAPLVVAEQFGTLESLFPGRIDLGLGRAPGTDQFTAHALRRTLASDPHAFPNDVIELIGYFAESEPGRRVAAVPGEGLKVPVWILGSSLFGAQLAAMLGLPYAFASHFAPAQMLDAIAIYRESFRPSEHLEAPYVMLGVNVFAAETDEEARYLMSSRQQAFVALRRGEPGRLPPPVEHYEERLTPSEKMMLDGLSPGTIVGSPESVRDGLASFLARTGADELIVTAQIFDHAARLGSYEILAEVHGLGGA
jgi:luciferase family oxidoreductase group 1